LATNALLAARTEFPDEQAFADLAAQLEAGIFEAEFQDLEKLVRANLSAHAVAKAADALEAARSRYAGHPRWKALEQEVAKRRDSEAGLREGEQQLNAGRLDNAESLVTGLFQTGVLDDRADQLRNTIRLQRAEVLRQAEIAQISTSIRDFLKAG